VGFFYDGTDYQASGSNDTPSIIDLTATRAAPTVVGAGGALYPNSSDNFIHYTNPSGVDFKLAKAITGACIIDNDTQSATALTAAEFSGRCVIPVAATITEVDVIGGTGTLTGSAAAPTVSGTSSIQLGKYTPNGGASTTGLLSGLIATASGAACVLTSTSGTCGNGNTSSNSVTISTTALSKGDVLYVSAASADSSQTWYNITVWWTQN
jgi:hypothetical protein